MDDGLSELDARMVKAGMTPISELLSRDPMGNFAAHAGIGTIEDFEWWVKSQHEQFMKMRMAYELGDKDKNDEMYEWIFAHSAVFSRVAVNLRKALGQPI